MAEKDTPLEIRIDTRVVRQLGGELITDPEQALLELIKNSYDADADRCRVSIDTKAESKFADGVRVENDADVAKLDPAKIETLKGRISVEDDGPGVTLDDIRERWLLISGSEKRPDVGQKKYATKKGRTPLGDKGIGRLGTMRLGDCVQFISRPKNSTQKALGVEFRWSRFDAAPSLDKVPVQEAEDVPSKSMSTRVMVEGLYEPEHWLSDDQSELQARISRLVSPFTEKHPLRVSIEINNKALELQRLVQDLELYATARHTFSFERTADGKDILTLTSDIAAELFGDKWSESIGKKFFESFTKKNPKYGLVHADKAKSSTRWVYRKIRKLDCSSIKGFDSKDHPGSFSGRIYSISFRAMPSSVADVSLSDSDEQETDTNNTITPPTGGPKALFQKLAGVNIYRDGFGVRIDPDWLEMSTGVTSGKSWYGMRRTNTVGHIDITSDGNSVLVEKSDREGFVDTPAWRQFMIIAKKIRDEINDMYEVLRRGFNDSQKIRQPSEHQSPTPEGAIRTLATEAKFAQSIKSALSAQETVLRQASELVDQFKGPLGQKGRNLNDEAAKALKTIRGLIARSAGDSASDAVELLREELRTLRSQVRTAYDFIAAGMAAETLAHEVHPLLDRASELIQSAEKVVRRSGADKAITDLQSARSYVRLVGKQLSLLNPMLKIYRETKDTIKLVDFLSEYKVYVSRRLNESGVQLKINARKPFAVHLPRGRLMQVIDNVVRNSEYWLTVPLARKSVTDPTITIEISKPRISIWDNGIGIKPEIEDRIFGMFVSDKPKETGRGLGLYITREILMRYGCDISLSEQRNSHDRRFRFDIDLTEIVQ